MVLRVTVSRFKFDWTITFGHVLTAVMFLSVAVAAYYGTRQDLAVMDRRLLSVEVLIAKLTELLIQARQDVRIGNLEKRVDRLEGPTPRRHEVEAR